MATRLFIIEHPTRGVLRSFDTPEEFHFSTVGLRGDPDTCELFFSLDTARRARSYLPRNVRERCQIRVSPNWAVVS